MKINKITLHNFGSYEGINSFITKENQGKNIVLIGGKNGAGKTTFFTAIRICLYGYMSLGYQNINSYYNRAIIKLINNTAKMKKPAHASVTLEISINNSRGIDLFVLTRSWILNDTLSETFSIVKNGTEMSEDEIADFEKYLLSLIPPELFNLYFFDGEKIADFFLNDGSNVRIKEAFLTLCGYDTFDIMRKNFKRISTTGENVSSQALSIYLDANEHLKKMRSDLSILEEEHKLCESQIDACNAEILMLEKKYAQNGGITQDEWDSKVFSLKEEEKKRETWNTLLKKWANDLIPFLMIRNQVLNVSEQIEKEYNYLKYKNFSEIVHSKDIEAVLSTIQGKAKKNVIETIEQIAQEQYGNCNEQILDLSFEQSSALMPILNRILDFDIEKVRKCKLAIKRSINKSAKIRLELENSNISDVKDYMQKRAELFEQKSKYQVNKSELEQQIVNQTETLKMANNDLIKAQAALETELKRTSINDISAKAIVMLDKLQKKLYHNQIEKVEAFFRYEIHSLMRKKHFIDDIMIDDSFSIHIYRNENYTLEDIKKIVSQNSEEEVGTLLGGASVVKIKELAKIQHLSELRKVTALNEDIILPVEIDKMSLSNGEKQIFIMALYHSLVHLCNNEIPFIIDTPFARIDTEHRNNIAKSFFSKLNGQVFILSTNEEISSSHVQILKDKISTTYTLENTDNKKTTVIQNTYFEV